MAIEARRGRADALLAFPARADPVSHHARLSRELPVIAFWLYEAAGGVAYDDATLHAILDLPGVIGIKVATLDSVMTFQRLAALLRAHPDKLLITGEDRFLGYSHHARCARPRWSAWAPRCPTSRPACSARTPTATGPAFTPARRGATGSPRRRSSRRWKATCAGCSGPPRRTARCRREACDDPWGPALPVEERAAVERAVRDARSAHA